MPLAYITGGVREEISSGRLMQDVEAEGVDEKEKVKRMQNIFGTKNLSSTQMSNPFDTMTSATTDHYSQCATFGEMRSIFVPQPAVTSNLFSFGAPTAAATFSLFGPSTTAPTSSIFGMPSTTSSAFISSVPSAEPTSELAEK